MNFKGYQDFEDHRGKVRASVRLSLAAGQKND
jgi:hypothetical protein